MREKISETLQSLEGGFEIWLEVENDISLVGYRQSIVVVKHVPSGAEGEAALPGFGDNLTEEEAMEEMTKVQTLAFEACIRSPKYNLWSQRAALQQLAEEREKKEQKEVEKHPSLYVVRNGVVN